MALQLTGSVPEIGIKAVFLCLLSSLKRYKVVFLQCFVDITKYKLYINGQRGEHGQTTGYKSDSSVRQTLQTKDFSTFSPLSVIRSMLISFIFII